MTRLAHLAAAPLVAAALLAAPAARAQVEPVYAPASQPARLFSQAELDQMLAPVALYPDSLLSQLLMAATYPLEIVQAARWSRSNPGLVGEDAVRAVQDRDWDPSVKSMVAFPQLLARMDEQIEWTERLGEAFLGQERQVMDTVQELRRRAHEAGNLRSSDEIVVRREVEAIYIDPPAPERVYVPYYDTRYVYGNWWWPGYEPVLWSPWSGYYYTPGYTAFGWGRPVYLGSGFFFGTFDWPRRYVRHTHHRPWYHHGHRWHNGERWRHDDRRSSWRHRARDRDGDGRPDWRDRDRNGDGRRDWRHRDRDGDGRPNGRDRDRDGDGRPNWRDGDNRGRGEGDGRRDGRGASVTPTPQAYEPAPGAAPARSAGTPISPRSSINAAPQPALPAARVAPQPSMPSATPAPAPRYAPAASPRYVPAPSAAPVRSAPAPAPAPMERAAPVERSAPVERPAPVREAPARESAPVREAPARESSPAPARGGFGRER